MRRERSTQAKDPRIGRSCKAEARTCVQQESLEAIGAIQHMNLCGIRLRIGLLDAVEVRNAVAVVVAYPEVPSVVRSGRVQSRSQIRQEGLEASRAVEDTELRTPRAGAWVLDDRIEVRNAIRVEVPKR